MTSDRAAGARRELRLALLLVLAGAALVLLAAGRTWLDVVVAQPAPLPPESEVRTGGDVVAALSPLGLLGLAGVAALAATRGRGRVALGVLLLAAGSGVVGATLVALARGATAALDLDPRPGQPALPDAGFGPWPWAAVLGGLLLALGGLVVAARGRRWAVLSGQYDAPGAARERAPARPEVAAWEALDRGEDPTSGPGPGAPTPGPQPPGPRA